MAKVATLFKVYVDQGNDAAVSKEIGSKLKPTSIQVEEVAFGIKIIKVMFVHEDTDGSTSFEDKLRNIKGVTEVEVAEESLL